MALITKQPENAFILLCVFTPREKKKKASLSDESHLNQRQQLMRYSTESFYSNHKVLINISIFFYRQIPFTVTLKTEAECDFGRVLLQIFMQRGFGGQNGMSPGQLSHCVMDLLQ